MRLNVNMKLVATLAFVATAAQADALPRLHDAEEVNQGILAVGIANQIRKKCPTISGRMFRAYFFIDKLRDRARDLGYSDAEIDAYLEDKQAKAIMKARGREYLTENGVVEDDAESYCALGRAEIKKSSQIGALLRAN